MGWLGHAVVVFGELWHGYLSMRLPRPVALALSDSIFVDDAYLKLRSYSGSKTPGQEMSLTGSRHSGTHIDVVLCLLTSVGSSVVSPKTNSRVSLFMGVGTLLKLLDSVDTRY